MFELGVGDAVGVIVAFLCLLLGLSFKLHRNHTIFIWSLFWMTSSIINPILFMANEVMYSYKYHPSFMINEHMYAYSGWSAVRSFDFSLVALVKSYSGSNFILSLIIIFSVPFFFLRTQKKDNSGIAWTSSLPKVILPSRQINHSTKKYGYLMFFCLFLMVTYYPLYNYGIGITGIPGKLPYHLSGATHYLRAYFIPIALAILLTRSGCSWPAIAIMFLYALVAGVGASSRFVAIVPMLLLIFYFIDAARYRMLAATSLYCFFLWFVITASRDLTFNGLSFDGEQHNLFAVLYYSVTNIQLDNMIHLLDMLSGRVSGGAQQMVLVSQMRGHEECGFISTFLLGRGDVCSDTAGILYGLDLSGTSFGLGLALIPSIVISGNSLIDYIIPSMFICFLIWVTQFVFLKIMARPGRVVIGSLYLFMSVGFIFLGQMSFYYWLNFFSAFYFLSRYLLEECRHNESL